MLHNTLSQPSNFRAKNWPEINDDARGTCNKNSKIKFKNSMLKSISCDTHIPVNGTITIDGKGGGDNAKPLGERNKRVILKNYAPFTGFISEINNSQIDNSKDLDVVIPMYNLIEYSDYYSKASGCLWKYYRDDPNDIILHSESFKFKIIRTGKNPSISNTRILK